MSEARRVVARCPGKLILLGEHSVVYGRPALVAAVGLEARVEAVAGRGAGVSIHLADLDVRQQTTWPELAGYAAAAREAWERYAEQPSRERFRAVRGTDPAHLVKVALGEVAGRLSETGSFAESPPPLELRVDSEIPIGSGFGSSAALAVGTLAAAFAALGAEAPFAELDRLALAVERRQHGLPSGADHNAVLRGGLLRVERRPDGGLAVAPAVASAALLARFAVYDTGTPAESTGEVVAAVRALREREKASFEARLDRMAGAVEACGRALAADDAEAAAAEVARQLRAFEGCLEELGVVPESIRRRIRRLEARGAAAKLSGAGALTEGGAGSLLVFRPPGCESLAAELACVAHYPVALGVPGLTVEAAP
jgi:mevalonate kinase